MARAICILGMHRSGTSLVAKLLDDLGVYFGIREDHLAPNFANPGGYWELKSIVRVHDAILQRFGRSWDTAFPLPDGWWDDPRTDVWRARLKRIVRQTFAGRDLFGWKDPRTCLTLPLWKRILDDLDTPVEYVLVFRNPLEVAQSLVRRNRFDPGDALGLWFHYNLEMITQTRGAGRTALRYEDLLDRPREEVRRVASDLGLAAADGAEPEGSVDPSLRHFRASSEELLELAPEGVVALHRLVSGLCSGERSWHDVDLGAQELRREWLEYAHLLRHDSREARRPPSAGERIHILSEYTAILESVLQRKPGAATGGDGPEDRERSGTFLARIPTYLRRSSHALVGFLMATRPLPYLALPGGVCLVAGLALVVRAMLRPAPEGALVLLAGLLAGTGVLLVLIGLLADHVYLNKRLIEALERRLGELQDEVDHRP